MSKTVLFQTIQFDKSTQFKFQNSSSSNNLVKHKHSFFVFLFVCFLFLFFWLVGGSLTPLQRCSRYILQPQPTGDFIFFISIL